MERGWQRIYFSDQLHRIEIVKAVLHENNIESVQVDKRDSSYIAIGEVELYVKDTDVMRAKYIIEKQNL